MMLTKFLTFTDQNGRKVELLFTKDYHPLDEPKNWVCVLSDTQLMDIVTSYFTNLTVSDVARYREKKDA